VVALLLPMASSCSHVAQDSYDQGMAAFEKEEYDLAIACFTEVIRLDPKIDKIHYFRGLAYFNKGEYDKAIADYDEAIHLDPSVDLLYYDRGVAYLDKGECDKAIADFSEAIRLAPKEAKWASYSARAKAYFNKSEYDRAIADCTEAIRLNQEYAEAYYNRGVTYEKKGDQAKAEADFAKAKELGYEPE
jgi:tetratricopeptide (TPR) repeat protein